jgi:hypothetical protein
VIQFDQSIADAYVLPARNVMLPSTPGRQVRFLQGHAVIKHGRDLVAMMRRPDVKIQLTPYALSWLDTFLAEAGERMLAEVQWPERAPHVEASAPLVAERSWDPSLRGEVTSGATSQGTDPGTE